MLYALIWVISGLIAGYLYQQRGRSQGTGFLGGLLLGPIGLVLAFLSPTTLIKCPHCAERVQPGAKICRYCGRDIPPASHPRRPNALLPAKQVLSHVTCPGCGAENKARSHTCIECGARIPAKTLPPESQKEVDHRSRSDLSLKQPNQLPSTMTSSEGKFVVCNRCNTENSRRSRNCIVCGARL